MMTLLDVQKLVALYLDDRVTYSERHITRKVLTETEDIVDVQLCWPAFHEEVPYQ